MDVSEIMFFAVVSVFVLVCGAALGFLFTLAFGKRFVSVLCAVGTFVFIDMFATHESWVWFAGECAVVFVGSHIGVYVPWERALVTKV
ncbi:MAG TPA: hypothetical protein VEA59_07390 [Patescibacteria group bacterium]|nr:hypothetical protein [Patescibacteria group bacterium]